MFVRIIITYLIREFIFNKPTLAPFPQKSYLTSGTWVVATTPKTVPTEHLFCNRWMGVTKKVTLPKKVTGQ